MNLCEIRREQLFRLLQYIRLSWLSSVEAALLLAFDPDPFWGYFLIFNYQTPSVLLQV